MASASSTDQSPFVEIASGMKVFNAVLLSLLQKSQYSDYRSLIGLCRALSASLGSKSHAACELPKAGVRPHAGDPMVFL